MTHKKSQPVSRVLNGTANTRTTLALTLLYHVDRTQPQHSDQNARIMSLLKKLSCCSPPYRCGGRSRKVSDETLNCAQLTRHPHLGLKNVHSTVQTVAFVCLKRSVL